MLHTEAADLPAPRVVRWRDASAFAIEGTMAIPTPALRATGDAPCDAMVCSAERSC